MKLIGPHTPNELELLVSGKKHVASLCIHSFARIAAVCTMHGFYVVSYPTAFGAYTDVLIYREGYEHFANQIIKIYARICEKGHMTLTDHAKLGIAYGYPKEAIRHFIEKQKEYDKHTC